MDRYVVVCPTNGHRSERFDRWHARIRQSDRLQEIASQTARGWRKCVGRCMSADTYFSLYEQNGWPNIFVQPSHESRICERKNVFVLFAERTDGNCANNEKCTSPGLTIRIACYRGCYIVGRRSFWPIRGREELRHSFVSLPLPIRSYTPSSSFGSSTEAMGWRREEGPCRGSWRILVGPVLDRPAYCRRLSKLRFSGHGRFRYVFLISINLNF